jgi:NAD+ synthase (glutamine-hydrolysing)
MSSNLTLVMAQISLPVGDIVGNCEKIIAATKQAVIEHRADLVVFPELSLTGYPPEDLLLRPSLTLRINDALEKLLSAELPAAIAIGLPARNEKGELFNQAVVINGGKIIASHNKRHLPNYQVFDEKRYFTAGNELTQFEFKGFHLALDICEDIWFDDTFEPAENSPAIDAHIVLNASPFHLHRLQQRHDRIQTMAKKHQQAVVYVNQVCGQDELVFDGGSFAVDAHGEIQVQANQFEAELVKVVLTKQQGVNIAGEKKAELSLHASAWQAMVLGLKDYVNRNGFKGVVLGLSGGIDSGISVALAVDALGSERVHAIMMPFKYTSPESIQDAAEQADMLNVKYDVVDIESIYDSALTKLSPIFDHQEADTTEQNMQARIRGLLLMSVSNKNGHMVLTTGNKSELAVGYCTLYGDMCGGYNVLKDCPKTLVFELAKYRNTLSPAIPERVITRPPSAELAPDQKDEDSLPPYDILDDIIDKYVEQDMSLDDIVAAGHDFDVAKRIVWLIDMNEYKRRQSPEGVRLTPRGFGRDRRYPITQGWKSGK